MSATISNQFSNQDSAAGQNSFVLAVNSEPAPTILARPKSEELFLTTPTCQWQTRGTDWSFASAAVQSPEVAEVESA
jgi:hypothetical protein